MNDESNMMEGDILKEEALTEPVKKPEPITIPKKSLPKIDPAVIKTKILLFRKPKLITVIVVFLLVILSFSLLIVLDVKRPKEDIVNPDVVIASPKSTSAPDKVETEIEKNLRTYEEKVKNLDDSIGSYPPPKVDLDFEF